MAEILENDLVNESFADQTNIPIEHSFRLFKAGDITSKVLDDLQLELNQWIRNTNEFIGSFGAVSFLQSFGVTGICALSFGRVASPPNNLRDQFRKVPVVRNENTYWVPCQNSDIAKQLKPLRFFLDRKQLKAIGYRKPMGVRPPQPIVKQIRGVWIIKCIESDKRMFVNRSTGRRVMDPVDCLRVNEKYIERLQKGLL